MIFSKFKGFIFDFDLTLVDTKAAIAFCYNAAFREMGMKEHPSEAIARLIGVPLRDGFVTLTGINDSHIFENYRERYWSNADKYMTPMTQWIPGVPDILKEIRKNGKHSAIVTTKYSYYIKDFLAKESAILNTADNQKPIVDLVIGGEDVKNHKPDPEGLQKATDFLMSQYGLQKEEILYTGDNAVDAEAASKAGLSYCGVLTGTTEKEKLSAFPHVAVLPSVASLLTLE